MARPKANEEIITARIKHQSRTYEAVIDGTTSDRRFRRVVFYEYRKPARRVVGIGAWDARNMRFMPHTSDLPEKVSAKLEAGLAAAAA
jgi:hypothetical protein